MKKIKDLNNKDRAKLLTLIKDSGFSIVKDLPSTIIFKKGYRFFSISSLNLNNEDFGLKTSFDLASYFKKHLVYKKRHSSTFKGKLFKSFQSTDLLFRKLNWKISILYTHNPFAKEIDDPLADTLYELLINDKPHVLIDGEVYEGSLGPFISIGKLSAIDVLNEISNDIIESIKKIT